MYKFVLPTRDGKVVLLESLCVNEAQKLLALPENNTDKNKAALLEKYRYLCLSQKKEKISPENFERDIISELIAESHIAMDLLNQSKENS
jgi:hypothetical protein